MIVISNGLLHIKKKLLYSFYKTKKNQKKTKKK